MPAREGPFYLAPELPCIHVELQCVKFTAQSIGRCPWLYFMPGVHSSSQEKHSPGRRSSSASILTNIGVQAADGWDRTDRISNSMWQLCRSEY